MTEETSNEKVIEHQDGHVTSVKDKISEETLVKFIERQWLNDEDSSFTGSVVTYFKATAYITKDENDELKSRTYDIDGFIEFADCQNKIRIHTDWSVDTDISKQKYLNKLNRLKDIIDTYIEVIENTDLSDEIRTNYDE